MSAPLLIAAMMVERRNRRPARKSRLLLRLAAAAVVGATVVAVTTPASAAASRRSERVTIEWVGGPTMLIRFGPFHILTDPVLGEGPTAFRIFDPNTGTPDAPQSRLVPLPRLALAATDLVLLSHAHEDHLDAVAIERLPGGVSVLLPEDQEGQVRARGLTGADGIAWRESRILEQDGYRVSITAVAARHTESPAYLAVLGSVNGYWLEFRRGDYRRTIYWTGDSFAPAEGVPNHLRGPDLFVPHLGGVGAGGPIGPVSMTAMHALAFARAVRPRAVLPIHHSTFSLYREPIGPFLAAAERAELNVVRLREGKAFALP